MGKGVKPQQCVRATRGRRTVSLNIECPTGQFAPPRGSPYRSFGQPIFVDSAKEGLRLSSTLRVALPSRLCDFVQQSSASVQCEAEQSRAEQSSAEKKYSRVEQKCRAKQDREALCRAEQRSVMQSRAGQSSAVLCRAEQGRAEQSYAEQSNAAL
jgi:hypothetical protein